MNEKEAEILTRPLFYFKFRESPFIAARNYPQPITYFEDIILQRSIWLAVEALINQHSAYLASLAEGRRQTRQASSVPPLFSLIRRQLHNLKQDV